MVMVPVEVIPVPPGTIDITPFNTLLLVVDVNVQVPVDPIPVHATLVGGIMETSAPTSWPNSHELVPPY